MAGDNSFEQQLLDFYGYKKIMINLLDGTFEKDNDKFSVSNMAKLSIMNDIAQKYSGISNGDLASAKNKMQIEMYNQLEKDRQNGK